MKIGIDASRAAKKQRTGTETYSYYLIRELLRLDQSNVYILYTQEKLPDEIRQHFRDGVEERVISGTFLWSQVALPRAAKKDALDVLFVPSHVLPRRYSGKTVLTIHGLEYEQYSLGYSFFQKKYLQWTTAYGAKKASKVITPSSETKNLLGQYYGIDQDKIMVIPHGGNTLEIEKSAAISCEESNDDYFLFIGSLEPRKNLEVLLKAYVLYVETGGQKKLIIAGRRSQFFDALLELLMPGTEQKGVDVKGYISNKEYVCLLKNASALILPSFAEGFGMPVLDAAQYGIPVIGSRHGFSADFFADSILMLEDEKNEIELFEKITLVSNGQVDQGYLKNKKELAVKYTWEKNAREMFEMITR